MAIVEAYSGSASISTTEYSLVNSSTTLASDTTEGVYQLFLDLSALTVTEVYELKVYEKVTSSATQRVVYSVRFSGVQGCPNWVSPSLVLLHGWEMSLNKISGTDRTILWSIRKVG